MAAAYLFLTAIAFWPVKYLFRILFVVFIAQTAITENSRIP